MKSTLQMMFNESLPTALTKRKINIGSFKRSSIRIGKIDPSLLVEHCISKPLT